MITTTINAVLPISEGFKTNTIEQAMFEFRVKYPKAEIETIICKPFFGLDELGSPVFEEPVKGEVVVEEPQNVKISIEEQTVISATGGLSATTGTLAEGGNLSNPTLTEEAK